MTLTTINLTAQDIPENVLTPVNFGGSSFLFYRMGDMMNVYNANKENPKSLLPYPFKYIQQDNLAIALIPVNTEEKYNVSLLGKSWFIAYSLIEEN